MSVLPECPYVYHACTMCVPGVSGDQKVLDSLDCSYRWLWVIMLVLGTELKSSESAASVPNHCVIFPASVTHPSFSHTFTINKPWHKGGRWQIWPSSTLISLQDSLFHNRCVCVVSQYPVLTFNCFWHRWSRHCTHTCDLACHSVLSLVLLSL